MDFAQLHKVYGTDPKLRGAERRYTPPVCTGTQVTVVSGDPDPGEISTSYVERQNLTMRMGMRRFTWLTNGFSKKVENLAHAISLHYMHTTSAGSTRRSRPRLRRRPESPTSGGACETSPRCSTS